ncbi:uncharacterized protein LOC132196492 [Neocloeon triangulifer]|uniref:uncharacterized protein LOC132196492 n=1 Tax=Neocloeon triangulifer TaxID=2078957 RepID=UPI00286EF8FC|nr:uncharacterized protein LOC132196492 [Neocloeon triangulifer]
MYLKLICVAVLCGLQIDLSYGLKCYSCTQSGVDNDRKCETNPKSIQNSAINCNKKYCVIRRIEFVDQPKGPLFSFYRGCEQRPDFINTEITDSQFKTYYRACTTNLCNDGDGRTGSGSGGGINSDGSDGGGAIMVPGIGENASANMVPLAGMSLLVFIFTIKYFLC